MQLNINAPSYYSNPAGELPHPRTPLTVEKAAPTGAGRGSQSSPTMALTRSNAKPQPRGRECDGWEPRLSPGSALPGLDQVSLRVFAQMRGTLSGISAISVSYQASSSLMAGVSEQMNPYN